MNAAADKKPASRSTARNAVKLVGESVTPGASLLLDGKVRLGIIHALAASAMGGFGVYLGLNSYTKSVTGKHLHQHIFRRASS